MTISPRSLTRLRYPLLGLCAALMITIGPISAATTPSLQQPQDPSAVQLLVSAAVPNSIEAAALRPQELVVGAGKSIILELDSKVTRVSMANPSVADTVVISPQQILINGLVPGSTSLVMWFESGVPKFYDLTVIIDTQGLGEDMKAFFPHENILVGTTKGTLVLNGTVSNTEIGERAVMIASEYSGNVINNMTYPESGRNQIALKIMFAEVSKEAITELSASFSLIDPNNPRGANEGLISTGNPAANGSFLNTPTGPDFNFNDAINLYAFNFSNTITGFISALKSRGDLQILAEPTLMAADGEEASFLAGGEFPIPVAQAGAGFTSVTIIFKKFGISIDFKPTIRNRDTIVLRVKPEVSTLDFANAVTLSGFRIPALRVRRADTEIELKNGQSFAIAGLYSADLQQTKSKIPILGDIPLLGYLFRSKNLNKRKTELLVIATPTIVYANPPGNLPELPKFDLDMELDKNKKEEGEETAIQDLELNSEEQISEFLEGYEEPILIDPSEFYEDEISDATAIGVGQESSGQTSISIGPSISDASGTLDTPESSDASAVVEEPISAPETANAGVPETLEGSAPAPAPSTGADSATLKPWGTTPATTATPSSGDAGMTEAESSSDTPTIPKKTSSTSHETADSESNDS